MPTINFDIDARKGKKFQAALAKMRSQSEGLALEDAAFARVSIVEVNEEMGYLSYVHRILYGPAPPPTFFEYCMSKGEAE